MSTVTLTIDGRQVTVPEGTSLLHAAQEIGVEVPHYCYHPALSAPAQCRLCLVDVEGAPKPMPSCVTQAQDGQVVRTDEGLAREMRKGVLEFYLINHPLDCPICDQSGECKLQDYVHSEGRAHGRGIEPKRVFGRDDFGGDVLFYGDRCVMCTRCVRFMEEMAQDPVLTVVERGDRAVIDTFFEQGLRDSPYAGNIVDICPVGGAGLQGLSAQGARLGPRPHPVRVSQLLAGMQYRHPHPRQRGESAQAPRKPGGQRPLDVRLWPRPLRVVEPRRPHRGAVRARGRRLVGARMARSSRFAAGTARGMPRTRSGRRFGPRVQRGSGGPPGAHGPSRRRRHRVPLAESPGRGPFARLPGADPPARLGAQHPRRRTAGAAPGGEGRCHRRAGRSGRGRRRADRAGRRTCRSAGGLRLAGGTLRLPRSPPGAGGPRRALRAPGHHLRGAGGDVHQRADTGSALRARAQGRRARPAGMAGARVAGRFPRGKTGAGERVGGVRPARGGRTGV